MEIFTNEFKNSFKKFVTSRKTITWTCVAVGVAIAVTLYFTLEPMSIKKIPSGKKDADVISSKSLNSSKEKVDTTIYEYGIPISSYDLEEGVIRKGDFFSTLLTRLDVSQNTIYRLTQKCKGVFDLKQIKVGNKYQAYFTQDSLPSLAYLVYERDGQSFVVFTLQDTLGVEIFEKEIKTTLEYSEITINNSLWVDLSAAGVSPILALKLSEIYAWSIDFFGLQKGDSFKALYEVMSYKGDILDIGKVRYAVFNHASSEYPVYYYDVPGTTNKYWNEKGESMRKAFLKAPLSFTRISSSFSYARKHPITRQVRPHTGVDYAAPTGTPVMSIGDGVVIAKGYNGGGGNTVKIKHNSVYTSAYLHLSKYGKGIAVGSRVSQGQVIGYVGSTGSSTGPHLDFRIWKNGTPINPLKMQSPPAEPIKKDLLPSFQQSQQSSLRLIDHLKAETFFRKAVETLR